MYMKYFNINTVLLIIICFLLIIVISNKLIVKRIVFVKNEESNQNPKVDLVPINVNTRNIDHYQQLGILYDGHTTLPLLGRRVYSGSHKWNYYTLTNNNVAIKVPLSYNGRDCLDSYGCDELYSDDSIIIPEFNNSKFKIKLYDLAPRYLPF